jgi:hypothetical protein
LILESLDVRVIVILDDCYNGFICFPQWKASKIKVPKAKTYAGLYTKLTKNSGQEKKAKW